MYSWVIFSKQISYIPFKILHSSTYAHIKITILHFQQLLRDWILTSCKPHTATSGWITHSVPFKSLHHKWKTGSQFWTQHSQKQAHLNSGRSWALRCASQPNNQILLFNIPSDMFLLLFSFFAAKCFTQPLMEPKNGLSKAGTVGKH